jgi:putative transposase
MIQEVSHLQMAMRYIEGNPVRAGLVPSAKEWKWSSHEERLDKREMTLTDEVPIELPREWDRYVDEPFREKELARLRMSIKRQTPFGDTTWQMKICKEFGLESTMKRR